MIVFIYAVIALGFVSLGIGGIMYLDHKFSNSVAGRSYAMKGRRIETDDPFVRSQYRKFYALRVLYSVGLICLLVWIASNVG